MVVKERLHSMIDQIDDERLLHSLYSLLSRIHENKTGKLYESLSDTQKEGLAIAYEESFDEENQLDHEDVKSEYSKWL